MLSDIYRGAFNAARRMRAQFADAQDAAQDAVLSALRKGKPIDRPRAYGSVVARRSIQRSTSRPAMVALSELIEDRSSIDVSSLREALALTGADRWYGAKAREKERIRARLAREGWAI